MVAFEEYVFEHKTGKENVGEVLNVQRSFHNVEVYY